MRGVHQRAASFILALIFCASGILVVSNQNVLAQVTTAITSSGLNTQVSAPTPLPSGQITHDITGGTRPGNGPNLFHSFGEFSVGANHIANFLNETALSTSNILGRVTGGNVSNIFGTIQTTGFGNANLFLMNPAGFLFGPTATLNVGGIVAFTSADYLRLADGVRFNSIPKPAADALLSVAPVAVFGFLGSNPGAITVQGSQLGVADGTGISLVGGNITIQSGALDNGTVHPARLSAPGGQINLVSVGQPQYPNKGGEINASDFSPNPARGFSSMGTIALSEGTTVTASGDGVTTLNGGTVVIRGGQLTVANSRLEANGGGFACSATGCNGGTIEVHAGAVALDHATMSAGGHNGNGGQIRFMDLDTLSSTQSTLDVSTAGANPPGAGGTIIVGSPTTKSIALTATNMTSTESLPGGSQPPKSPAEITLTAWTVSIDGGIFNTLSGGSIPGGLITLNGDRIAIKNASFVSGNFDEGAGGTFTFQGLRSTGVTPTAATAVSFDGSRISDFGEGPGANITVHARALTLNNSNFSLNSAPFGGGPTINLADVGTLTSTGSFLSIAPFNRGLTPSIILGSSRTSVINLQDTGIVIQNSCCPSNQIGTINLTASRLNISGGSISTGGGATGNITVNVGDFTLNNGAQICSGCLFFGTSTGGAGTVAITATGMFQSTGSTVRVAPTQGAGGQISITAGNLSLTGGSTVSADSTGGGNAGTVQLKAGNNLLVNESVVSANSTGGANAGSIQLKAGNNLKLDNSTVTANSTGTGNAGSIQLKAGNDILLNQSTVSAQTDGTGNVGTIQLKAGDRIILRDSVVTPAPTIVSE